MFSPCKKSVLCHGLTRCAFAVALVAPVTANEPFTLVVLPDTQNYAEYIENRPLFAQQTQWIADQVQTEGNPRNIQFVSHVGDIVSYGGSPTQWQVASDAMGLLDGVAKYSVLPGNHDFNLINQKDATASNYVANFGPQRFHNESWYGGADPSGYNSFQRFTAGGYDFIHLALEWRPTENEPVREVSPIEWAQSVLDANPNTPVILSTHENLIDTLNARSAHGNALWEQFVSDNDQIFMTLNGHFTRGAGSDVGESHRVVLNDAGRPVFEVVQNYQTYPNGGDGWLRLFNFDIPNNQIAVETYSPLLDQFQTERISEVGHHASQFELSIDFESRLNPLTEPDYLFQDGVNGFAGTRDKELRASGNDHLNGHFPAISIDGNDGPIGLQPNHGLIQFEDFIGDGSGQLPENSNIERAVLVLDVFNGGSGFSVHEMLMPWDESSTWLVLDEGVQGDGFEATATVLDSFGAANFEMNVPSGRLEIDVTSTVQAYLDGLSENFGWALLPHAGGDNGVDFYTSEYVDVNRRPKLQIFLSDPSVPGDFNSDDQVNGADLLSWQRGDSADPFSSSDLLAWGEHYGASSAPLSSSDVVPEPASESLVAITLLFLRYHSALRRRKRFA